jgi:staphylococcal nuclease domain-containing protein 1
MVLQAQVKSALSGDTLILTLPSDPTKERTLSLAYVTAPRLRREGDEVSPYPDSPDVPATCMNPQTKLPCN